MTADARNAAADARVASGAAKGLARLALLGLKAVVKPATPTGGPR